MPFVPEARHQESQGLIWTLWLWALHPLGPFPKGFFLVQVFDGFSITAAFVQMNCIWNP